MKPAAKPETAAVPRGRPGNGSPYTPHPHPSRTRRELLDGEHDVDVADDVVVLREHGALAVDHAVGRAALLAEVHDRVGAEAGDGLREELPVADVADLQVDLLAADLAPPG